LLLCGLQYTGDRAGARYPQSSRIGGLNPIRYLTLALVSSCPSSLESLSACEDSPSRLRRTTLSILVSGLSSPYMQGSPARSSSECHALQSADQAANKSTSAATTSGHASTTSTGQRHGFASSSASGIDPHALSTASLGHIESAESQAELRLRAANRAPQSPNLNPFLEYSGYGYAPGGPLV